jgi:hypothetical protein
MQVILRWLLLCGSDEDSVSTQLIFYPEDCFSEAIIGAIASKGCRVIFPTMETLPGRIVFVAPYLDTPAF